MQSWRKPTGYANGVEPKQSITTTHGQKERIYGTTRDTILQFVYRAISGFMHTRRTDAHGLKNEDYGKSTKEKTNERRKVSTK